MASEEGQLVERFPLVSSLQTLGMYAGDVMLTHAVVKRHECAHKSHAVRVYTVHGVTVVIV